MYLEALLTGIQGGEKMRIKETVFKPGGPEDLDREVLGFD